MPQRHDARRRKYLARTRAELERTTTPTAEELARSLVKRGLAAPMILEDRGPAPRQPR